MKRLAWVSLLVIGAAAFAATPVLAQCGGGGCGGGGAAGGRGGGGCDGCGGEAGGCGSPKCPSEALGGCPTDSDEATGMVYWVESSGEAAPEVTSTQDGPKAAGEVPKEIQEIEKAREELRPVLVFYGKLRDPMAIGDKAAKDPEVAACEALDNALWKRLCIAERSRGFVCVRVNLLKADPQLLKKHGVSRAPVVEILDLDLKQANLTVTPSIAAPGFAKVLDAIIEKAEKEVCRLAKLEEDTPRVLKAKERVQEFAGRDLYREGLKALDKGEWAKAEAKFKDAVALPAESEWKEKARVGLVETEAGRDFQKAEALCKEKRYKEAEGLLQKILSDCKEAKYFGGLASEKLDIVRKKLEK